MSITQSTYVENLASGRPGQSATSATCDGDSYVAGDDIEFGRAVRRGSSEDQVLPGLRLPAEYLGVSFKDSTRDPSEEDKFTRGAHAGVAYRGDLYISPHEAVVADDIVTARTSDGVLGKTDPSEISSILVTAGGDSYTSDPAVAFTAVDGGTGAAGTAVRAGNAVVSVTVTNAGSGYKKPPTVSFSGGGGIGCRSDRDHGSPDDRRGTMDVRHRC